MLACGGRRTRMVFGRIKRKTAQRLVKTRQSTGFVLAAVLLAEESLAIIFQPSPNSFRRLATGEDRR
jgi:hypothetical protein